MRRIILGLITVCFWACSPKLVKESTPQTMKIMSYNIHHANPPSKSGVIDLDAIAGVILKESPDLVGLQEVDRFTKRSGGLDQAKLLAEKTGLYYQFFKAIDHDGGDYGLAILSKYPIVNSKQLALPQVVKGEARIMGLIEVVLAGNKRLVFSNTHLDSQKPDSNRIVQMKRLVDDLQAIKFPTLLVGDLNCEAGSEPITYLDQTFKRSCLLNCAPTIPQDKPRKTIDFIALRNANWQVKEHRVVPELYASDHRPVVVTYQVN